MRIIIIVVALLIGGAIWFWLPAGETSIERDSRSASHGPEQTSPTEPSTTHFRPANSAPPGSDANISQPEDEADAGNNEASGPPYGQRAALASFNAKYMGALSFRSTEQEEWALKNGFPSIEELTEAASMTTEELKARAGTGNPAFEGLYFDRLLDEGLEQIRLVGDGGSSIESYLKTSEGRALTFGIRRQSEAVLRTESPFAGYLLFRYNDEFTGNRNRAIASLAFGVQRGDRRLNRTIRIYADRNGIPQQALEILGEYSVMTQHSLDEHPDLIPIQ